MKANEMRQNSGLAHCVHHNQHWEYCYDYRGRVEFIKANKPKRERKLRLKLLQLVPDELVPGRGSDEWKACNKAREALNKATKAYYEAWNYLDSNTIEAFNKATDDYNKAWEAHKKAWNTYLTKYANELQALHDKIFPDCTWNGKTIFPTKPNSKG